MESGENPERARRRDMQKAFFYQNTATLRQAIEEIREGEKSAQSRNTQPIIAVSECERLNETDTKVKFFTLIF